MLHQLQMIILTTCKWQWQLELAKCFNEEWKFCKFQLYTISFLSQQKNKFCINFHMIFYNHKKIRNGNDEEWENPFWLSGRCHHRSACDCKWWKWLIKLLCGVRHDERKWKEMDLVVRELNLAEFPHWNFLSRSSCLQPFQSLEFCKWLRMWIWELDDMWMCGSEIGSLLLTYQLDVVEWEKLKWNWSWRHLLMRKWINLKW